MKKLLTIEEVGQLIGLRPRTIYKKLKAGEFPPPIKLGRKANRWDQQKIEGWIHAGCPQMSQTSS